MNKKLNGGKGEHGPSDLVIRENAEVGRGDKREMVTSCEELNFEMSGDNPFMNEEFYVEVVDRSVREFFKSELDNFIGLFPLSGLTHV